MKKGLCAKLCFVLGGVGGVWKVLDTGPVSESEKTSRVSQQFDWQKSVDAKYLYDGRTTHVCQCAHRILYTRTVAPSPDPVWVTNSSRT